MVDHGAGRVKRAVVVLELAAQAFLALGDRLPERGEVAVAQLPEPRPVWMSMRTAMDAIRRPARE